MDEYINKGKKFNVFGYSYNCPTFEWPYISLINGFNNKSVIDSIFDTLKAIMWDDNTKQFSNNQPDIETWNARTYEIVRYLDKI